MLSSVFHTVIYEPLYNGLVFLIDIVPGHSAGIAVILLTILVRLLLFPSSRKAIRSQMALQEIKPEIDAINTKYKDNREERARKTLELYRERNISPIASIVPLLIQIPIILALYFIFARSGLPVINQDILYSFVSFPDMVSTNFFNLLDITQKSLPVALIAGLTQFIQAYVYRHLSQKRNKHLPEDRSFQADFQKSMNFQMQYVFPIFVAYFAYHLSAAIALYWTTTNLFSIMQEIIARRVKEGDSLLQK